MIGISFYDCKAALRRLDDYLDRELTPYEMRSVKIHLVLCRLCARKFKFEANVIREVRAKLQHIPVSPNLLDKVSEALEQAQRQSPDE